jgi:uncharacterized membrane protein YkvI
MLDKIIAAARSNVSRRKLYLSALLSSVIISAFAYLILHSIRVRNAENFAVPLLYISNTPVTFVMILLAILTSQYSALFSVVSTIAPKQKNKKLFVWGAALLSFGCSFLGFTKLVGIGYPIIGAIIFLSLILPMLTSWFLRKRCAFPHIHEH